MAFFSRIPVPFYAVAVLLGALLAYNFYTLKPSGDPWRLKHEDAQIVALGKQVYVDHCASCHGANLEGEPHWRTKKPSGRLPAPPHDESGHTWHHDDAALFNLTKFGPQYVAGAKYESDMPAFDGVLSDKEIMAALSYIKSTWPAKVIETHDEINRRAQPQ